MKKHPLAGARERARALRRDMTDAERAIWRVLRLRQIDGCRFRRQVPIGRYIADFVCHQAGVIIEIDGGQHHSSSCEEIERTRFLEQEGYRVLRFWNNDVLANLDAVYRIVAEVLRSPSPSMGEGRVGVISPVARAVEALFESNLTPTHTLPHRGGGL
jgi:very-short-patch-repair endonuclease